MISLNNRLIIQDFERVKRFSHFMELFTQKFFLRNKNNENHDIAIAMSSSLADPVLGLNILQG